MLLLRQMKKVVSNLTTAIAADDAVVLLGRLSLDCAPGGYYTQPPLHARCVGVVFASEGDLWLANVQHTTCTTFPAQSADAHGSLFGHSTASSERTVSPAKKRATAFERVTPERAGTSHVVSVHSYSLIV